MMTTRSKAEFLEKVCDLQSMAGRLRAIEFEKAVMPMVDSLLRESGYGIWYVRSNKHPISSHFASPEAVHGNVLKTLAAYIGVLQHIEWRMLEQLMAEAFRHFGFCVNLTPSARDKGRDIELEWVPNGIQRTFLAEIKHWPCGKRVGPRLVTNFIKVVVRERADGGLMLSSSGYATSLLEGVVQGPVVLGDSKRIQGICRLFMRVKSGLLIPQDQLEVVVSGNGWPTSFCRNSAPPATTRSQL